MGTLAGELFRRPPNGMQFGGAWRIRFRVVLPVSEADCRRTGTDAARHESVDNRASNRQLMGMFESNDAKMAARTRRWPSRSASRGQGRSSSLRHSARTKTPAPWKTGRAMIENSAQFPVTGKLMVPWRGLEPPRCYPLVPETSASTNSATRALGPRLSTVARTALSIRGRRWAHKMRDEPLSGRVTPVAKAARAPARWLDEREGRVDGVAARLS